MRFDLRTASLATLLLIAIGATSTRAAEFTDSAGRIVNLPDRIGRVMPAEPAAEVLVFVLAPDRLIGWAQPPRAGPLPARYARLPVTGQLTGPNPTATSEAVARLHPDVIIDAGKVTPERAAFADQMQRATGRPYILVDSSIDRMPLMLRTIGKLLGVAERGEELAMSAEHAINTLRGVLLIQSPTERPRVYYGRGPDGLETPLPGSPAEEVMANAGVINVATPLGRGELVRITRQQLLEWNPDVIIAETASFYNALHRDPSWRNLTALRNKKVFLEPSLTFGWIDDPPGVNRLIGLYWFAGFRPELTLRPVSDVTLEFYSQFYGIKLSDQQVAAIAKSAGISLSETPNLGNLPPLPAPGPGLPPAGVGPPGRRGT
jgi:iron complex transport system substrate-binding protein